MGTTTKNPHKTEIRAGVSPLVGVVRIDQIAGYTVASPLVSKDTKAFDHKEWAAACDDGFQLEAEGIRVGRRVAHNWAQYARAKIVTAEYRGTLADPDAVY